jgi:hypothetical protein
MKGIRIFERLGFNLPKSTRESKSTLFNQFDEWEFDPKQFDWLNIKNEATLSGYMPTNELLNLLTFNIQYSGKNLSSHPAEVQALVINMFYFSAT